jgi:hypothetical protein
MSPTVYQSPLKTKATMAATLTYDTAVELTEPTAALMSFRWNSPSLPPTPNVTSAASPIVAAVQFSGNTAIYAANAVTTATFATF